VLLLFNDADELSFESIKEQLGVDEDKELTRTLLSLSLGKVRQLLRVCLHWISWPMDGCCERRES
jgi:hypothetical protein